MDGPTCLIQDASTLLLVKATKVLPSAKAADLGQDLWAEADDQGDYPRQANRTRHGRKRDCASPERSVPDWFGAKGVSGLISIEWYGRVMVESKQPNLGWAEQQPRSEFGVVEPKGVSFRSSPVQAHRQDDEQPQRSVRPRASRQGNPLKGASSKERRAPVRPCPSRYDTTSAPKDHRSFALGLQLRDLSGVTRSLVQDTRKGSSLHRRERLEPARTIIIVGRGQAGEEARHSLQKVPRL